MAPTTTHDELLADMRRELSRIGADDIVVRLDEKFAPDMGVLVHVKHGSAYWHMLPEHFMALLKEQKPRAGSEGVKIAIEKNAHPVWHGPEPEGSRDAASPS